MASLEWIVLRLNIIREESVKIIDAINAEIGASK